MTRKNFRQTYPASERSQQSYAKQARARHSRYRNPQASSADTKDNNYISDGLPGARSQNASCADSPFRLVRSLSLQS